MQYSPKLKRVMSEISQILGREDVGGFVVLHTPGYAELLTKLDPSYSCASIEDGGIRIRGKADRDFGGDIKKQTESLRDTSNMLNMIGNVAGPVLLGIINASDSLDKHLDAEHTDLGHTSHEEQNN